MSRSADDVTWPALPYAAWSQTLGTLHMWLQIVGKIRLKQTPHVNHWWETPLYVTARGLTTTPVPFGTRTFEIDVDFIDHVVFVRDCDGAETSIPLEPMSVAAFYGRMRNALHALDIDVRIVAKPNEVPDAIPFARDTVHASYDREYAHRFWRVLLQADRLLKVFRARFTGKASPVHFFWGAPDLAVTRFSGRAAPPHPGGFPNMPDAAMREAYSHEVSSAGFWPGNAALDACFYSYAYPVPEGFERAHAAPSAARFEPAFGEFVLPYEAVRQSDDPDGDVLQFLQSTYEAAADLARWNRAELER